MAFTELPQKHRDGTPVCEGARVASTVAFNIGAPETLAPGEEARLAGVKQLLKTHLDYDIDTLGDRVAALTTPEGSRNREHANVVFEELRATSKLLFLQWERTRQLREPGGSREAEFAFAKVFNQVTNHARTLNGEYQMVEQPEIPQLAEAIKQDTIREQAERVAAEQRGEEYHYDPTRLAQAMEIAARQRTADKAWLYVVLPTHPKQHYGRILLQAVDMPKDPWHPDDPPLKAFITQPFFTEQGGTLRHTHGINWAVSRPLGEGGTNSHINMLFEPRDGDNPLPMRKAPDEHDGQREYGNDTVVVIRPRDTHMIIGNRGRENNKFGEVLLSPSVADLVKMAAQDPREFKRYLDHFEFGALGSMHIYRPDIDLAREFVRDHPFREDDQYFDKADMFVFEGNTVWAGGGGAWPERSVVRHMEQGTHCGDCFEHDPRDRTLDPKEVVDKFVNRFTQLLSWRSDQLVEAA